MPKNNRTNIDLSKTLIEFETMITHTYSLLTETDTYKRYLSSAETKHLQKIDLTLQDFEYFLEIQKDNLSLEKGPEMSREFIKLAYRETLGKQNILRSNVKSLERIISNKKKIEPIEKKIEKAEIKAQEASENINTSNMTEDEYQKVKAAFQELKDLDNEKKMLYPTEDNNVTAQQNLTFNDLDVDGVEMDDAEKKIKDLHVKVGEKRKLLEQEEPLSNMDTFRDKETTQGSSKRAKTNNADVSGKKDGSKTSWSAMTKAGLESGWGRGGKN
jgi:hypothetical protein